MIQFCLAAMMLIAISGCCSCGESKVRTQWSDGFNDRVATLPRSAGPTLQSQALKSADVVALFYGPMPTGIAVSRTGRVFLNFPRWGDPVDHTVVEVDRDKLVPFPDAAITQLDKDRPATTLISVQSVVVDARDRLWILDTGSLNFKPVIDGGPKLMCVDLNTNKIVQTILFPPDVALKTSYVNDVRFDLNRGAAGTAYLTDSSVNGPNGLIVVDLATGRSWRRLSDHSSTKAESVVTSCEGRPLLNKGKRPTVGSDGIAVTPDGKTVYYCPMIGHHLHSVSADALADRTKSDGEVALTVKDLGDRGFASDGLECGPDGTVYLTDYENAAIRFRKPDGTYGVLCSDPRIFWPDSMAIATDAITCVPLSTARSFDSKCLYFTSNQLERQPDYRDGDDDRHQPYTLFSVRLDSEAGRPTRGAQ